MTVKISVNDDENSQLSSAPYRHLPGLCGQTVLGSLSAYGAVWDFWWVTRFPRPDASGNWLWSRRTAGRDPGKVG